MNLGYDNLPELSRQLLPCPHCGGTAHLANYIGGMHGSYAERRALKDKAEVVVECRCGIAIWGATTPQEAIKRWNMRAEDTPALKACPFCGSPANLVKGVPMWFGNDELYSVRCTNPKCRAEMIGSETAEQAIAMWNNHLLQEGETN